MAKKLYCSTCRKRVDEDSYDFISGECNRCLSKELRSNGTAGDEGDEEDEEEDGEEDGE